MRKPRINNPQLLELARFLKKASRENNAKIWRSVADTLTKARSGRTSVNLSRINRNTQKGQVVAVPGKVLGGGALHHPVRIAAFTFSATAREKVRAARGRCLTFYELVEKNPTGSNVKIVG